MNRRFLLLLVIAGAVILLSYVEFAFFTTLGGTKAVFIQIALLGVATALGTVLARNLVHAALYLVAFFFLIACLFVLLEAEFLAAMQVLVYIGAVAVLLMFGIMLTRNIQGDDTTISHWTRRIIPGTVSLGLFLILGYGILNQRVPGTSAAHAIPAEGRIWSEMRKRPDVGLKDNLNERGQVIGDMARTLGNDLMTRWVIPFELAGLLLTAALVGAVALARTEGEESPPDSSAAANTARRRDFGGNGHQPDPLDKTKQPAGAAHS